MKHSLWAWNFMLSDWDMVWDCHSQERMEEHIAENNPTSVVVMSESKPICDVVISIKDRVSEVVAQTIFPPLSLVRH